MGVKGGVPDPANHDFGTVGEPDWVRVLAR